MIVKVKEPQPGEIAMLEPRHLLFTYLHLAADKPQAEGLMKSGATCIAYETVTIALGRLALAQADERSRGPHVDPGRRALSRKGTGRPRRPARRRSRASPRPRSRSSAAASPGSTPRKWPPASAPTSPSTTSTTTGWPTSTCISAARSRPPSRPRRRSPQAVQEAELVIGAVLVPGAAAPKLVTRDMLKTMKRGIGAGRHRDRPGRLLRNQSRATTHDDPVYTIDGVIHYCVANMPGAVSRT